MSNPRARRFLAAAALLVAGTAAVGAGTAHAGTAPLPAYVAPPGGPGGPGDHLHHYRYHHHYHPNCNNDPDSEFAMDPEVCPSTHNDPGTDEPGY